MSTFQARPQRQSEARSKPGQQPQGHRATTLEPPLADSMQCACGRTTISSALGTPGELLDATTRAFMEPRLGYDLGTVRVHHDATAARSAQTQGANAYAVGRDLVFDAGQYAPHTPAGRKLLAHELTHAVQQNFSPNHTRAEPPANMDSSIETEAARAADTLAAGRSFRPVLRSPHQVACQARTGIITQNPLDAYVVGEADHGATHFNEIHYEQNSRGRDVLQVQRGTENYTLTRMAGTVFVEVRIHLVSAAPPHATYIPEFETSQDWLNGIRSVWNNRFTLTNGATNLTLSFSPFFTEFGAHHRVRVHAADSPAARTRENNWNEDDSGLTIAHEFGHMLGNPDEYRVPARSLDISRQSGLSEAERRRSNFEGITGQRRPSRRGGYNVPNSIMGDTGVADTSTLVPQPRHVQSILRFFNSHLLQPNEAAFRLGP